MRLYLGPFLAAHDMSHMVTVLGGRQGNKAIICLVTCCHYVTVTSAASALQTWAFGLLAGEWSPLVILSACIEMLRCTLLALG